MHGTTQQVAVSSSPTGAQVTVDAMERGTTPVIADLKRKDNHVIKVTMDGYQPFEMALTRSVSGWVWGNIVFGGLIGLAVDAITGGLYKVAPEQVTAELKADGALLQMAEGNELMLLTVVLAPRPGMERIGTLVPEVGDDGRAEGEGGPRPYAGVGPGRRGLRRRRHGARGAARGERLVVRDVPGHHAQPRAPGGDRRPVSGSGNIAGPDENLALTVRRGATPTPTSRSSSA